MLVYLDPQLVSAIQERRTACDNVDCPAPFCALNRAIDNAAASTSDHHDTESIPYSHNHPDHAARPAYIYSRPGGGSGHQFR